MRKGYTVETASQVLNNMAEVGLRCSVNVIVGFPGESWQDYLDTIIFIFKHRNAIANQPSLSACLVIPGSDIHQHPEKFGIRVPNDAGFDTVHWETIDGENTYSVREFRKEFMRHVFNQMNFSWKKMNSPDELDIQRMPNPFELYNKTNQKFSAEAYLDMSENLKLKNITSKTITMFS